MRWHTYRDKAVDEVMSTVLYTNDALTKFATDPSSTLLSPDDAYRKNMHLFELHSSAGLVGKFSRAYYLWLFSFVAMCICR